MNNINLYHIIFLTYLGLAIGQFILYKFIKSIDKDKLLHILKKNYNRDIIICIAWIALYAISILKSYFEKAFDNPKNYPVSFLLSSMLIFIYCGFILYKLKQLYSIYGLVEIILGALWAVLAVIIVIVPDIEFRNQLAGFLGIAGGLYVIVRGIESVEKRLNNGNSSFAIAWKGWLMGIFDQRYLFIDIVGLIVAIGGYIYIFTK